MSEQSNHNSARSRPPGRNAIEVLGMSELASESVLQRAARMPEPSASEEQA